MKRRNVLKAIATSSIATIGAGTVAGRTGPSPTSLDDLDTVHVVRDGDVVRTVENPSTEEIRRLDAALGDGQHLVSPEDDCVKYCCDDCPLHCSSCMCSCNDVCCDAAAETCGCAVDGCC